MKKFEIPDINKYSSTPLKDNATDSAKTLHVALYERRIAHFGQKYGLHLNQFLAKKRRSESGSKKNQINKNIMLQSQP